MDKRTSSLIEALVSDKRRMKIKIRNLESRIESLEKTMTFRKSGFQFIQPKIASK